MLVDDGDRVVAVDGEVVEVAEHPCSLPGDLPVEPLQDADDVGRRAQRVAVGCTPASRTAVTKAFTALTVGTATGKGHQHSMASNPASRAACGRCSSGSSVSRIEQLTS